ncbi:hypothetical protein V8D89_015647 [Ganoderma adspersum]
MNVPAHVVEPPLRLNELAQAKLFDHQTLKGVVLWSAGSLGTRHWRTGFEFVDSRSVVLNTTQGPPQPSAIMSPLLRPGTYDGISVDMFQPHAHQYYVPSVDGTKNLFGTLSVAPRLKGYMYSRTGNLFPIKFKVPVRVKDLLDLILMQQRQYYKFNPRGSGCLYWQLQLLEAFVGMGWIDKASLNAVLAEVTALASRANSGVPFPPVVGVFYPPPQGM